MIKTTRQLAWPQKVDLFGVKISPSTYEEITAKVIEAGQFRVPSVVSCHAVHAVVTSSLDPALRERVNSFDVVTPDGQPVRWAINLLYGAALRERIYGPQLMLDICKSAAEHGVSVYLYGGISDAAVSNMSDNLVKAFPDLDIAGYWSPPFRNLSAEEDEEVVRTINASGAGIVFVGLGFPKQDIFAADHSDRIQAVQVCVGAAFDFHAGTKKMAPAWMQRQGLEWLFRLSQEPKRLWKRYLVTNSVFVFKSVCALPRVIQMRRRYKALKRRSESD